MEVGPLSGAGPGVAQENALESAQSYVDMTGFSKQGLIQQLSASAGESFPKADAVFAANHVDVNWNDEAVESGAELPGHDLVLQGRADRAVVLPGWRRVHLGTGAVRGGQGLMMVGYSRGRSPFRTALSAP